MSDDIRAWHYIIDNWNVARWQPIPEEYKTILNLDSRVGMCNGMLVSRAGSQGMDDFIKRLNNKGVNKS